MPFRLTILKFIALGTIPFFLSCGVLGKKQNTSMVHQFSKQLASLVEDRDFEGARALLEAHREDKWCKRVNQEGFCYRTAEPDTFQKFTAAVGRYEKCFAAYDRSADPGHTKESAQKLSVQMRTNCFDGKGFYISGRDEISKNLENFESKIVSFPLEENLESGAANPKAIAMNQCRAAQVWKYEIVSEPSKNMVNTGANAGRSRSYGKKGFKGDFKEKTKCEESRLQDKMAKESWLPECRLFSSRSVTLPTFQLAFMGEVEYKGVSKGTIYFGKKSSCESARVNGLENLKIGKVGGDQTRRFIGDCEEKNLTICSEGGEKVFGDFEFVP